MLAVIEMCQNTQCCVKVCSCKPVRMPMLIPVQLSREPQNSTKNQWKKVSWSDESGFLLINYMDGHMSVHHFPGEKIALWQEGKLVEAV